MSKVVVSGATGFVGRNLVGALLARGDEVTALTRDPERARGLLPAEARLERWLDTGPSATGSASLEHSDAVVHLAGERAVGMRWTEKVKREIMDSRVDSTARLVSAIERAAHRPSVFVCASGVGYYGPHGNEPVDETAPPGRDFLAQVTIAWEAAAERASALGVRVVRARFGIVLGRGGALEKMVIPFRMFVGGPIASGAQVVSWVHMEDAVGILLRAIDDRSIAGPMNVATPSAVTSEELSAAIGKVLHRPSAIRVPEFALRLRFGEGADPLVTGQRAIPRVLLEKGYAFRYPRLVEALTEVLG